MQRAYDLEKHDWTLENKHFLCLSSMIPGYCLLTVAYWSLCIRVYFQSVIYHPDHPWFTHGSINDSRSLFINFCLFIFVY